MKQGIRTLGFPGRWRARSLVQIAPGISVHQPPVVEDGVDIDRIEVDMVLGEGHQGQAEDDQELDGWAHFSKKV